MGREAQYNVLYINLKFIQIEAFQIEVMVRADVNEKRRGLLRSNVRYASSSIAEMYKHLSKYGKHSTT